MTGKGSTLDIFRIHGGNRLNGSVKVSGSKNGALPILFASLLCDWEVTLQNVPIALRDIGMSLRILETLGVESEVAEDGSVSLQVTDSGNTRADYKQVSQMRASICSLGPLLARRGEAIVSLPGGCNIGDRPIDLHIHGMEALGAKVTIENGYVMARASHLRGSTVYLSGPMGPTVLGTQNVMMAAVGADGDTVIEGAACEPEVRATAGFLRAMGVKVEGDGTHEIHIEGQGRLEGAGCLGATSFDVPPDRIETGTYVLAGAIAGGEVTVEGCIPSENSALLNLLERIGVSVEVGEKTLTVRGVDTVTPVDVSMLPYPAFPTDLQGPLMALLCRYRSQPHHRQGVPRSLQSSFRVASLWRQGSQGGPNSHHRGWCSVVGSQGDGERSESERLSGAGGSGGRWNHGCESYLPSRSGLRAHGRETAWSRS